jgi:hypothetical protein
MLEYFLNKSCLIVTKHNKEKVIAPILKERLGLKCIAVDSIDTDILGTFTGEIERTDSPLTAVKKKCLLGDSIQYVDFIIANEGSFGPHPFIPFLRADEEYMCLYDKHEKEFIVEKKIFLETNFSSEVVTSIDQIDSILEKFKFPSHGIIIKSNNQLLKDLDSNIIIKKYASDFLKTNGHCEIDTDMRAMKNPTRMDCIAQLTKKLVDSILSTCEQCNWHGFKVKEAVEGLQCSLCNRPTKSILYHLLFCNKCLFEKKIMYPNNKFNEDPTYCDWCNP